MAHKKYAAAELLAAFVEEILGRLPVVDEPPPLDPIDTGIKRKGG